MARDVEHICSINDKYCQEGANPNRHPDHDSHMGGCICSLGEQDREYLVLGQQVLYEKILAHSNCTVERGYFDTRNILRITEDSAVEIVNYGRGENLAIECMKCHEVILDVNKPQSIGDV